MGDPLLRSTPRANDEPADNWRADPWDDVEVIRDSDSEELPPDFGWLKRPAQTFITVLAACVLLLGAIGFWGVKQLNPGGNGATVTFTVNEGDTLSKVVSRLASQGVVKNATLFKWYANTRGSLSLLPGYYSLKKGDSAAHIFNVLSTPPAQTFVKVTFPEGFTLAQMGDKLASKVSYMTAQGFTTAATDGSVTSALGQVGTASLEGLLFPDTYQVSGDDTATKVVKRMANMMERVARQENLDAGAKRLGYTPYQVMIVASMIEREAKVDADRPKIAAVIYNRMARKMNLEIDATLLYNQDPATPFATLKATDTPYNSYMHPGLPPTPIANPGRASIHAALNPAGTPPASDEACQGLPKGTQCAYLYYVLADSSGRHAFATTYEQHLANVEKARAAGLLP
jgi:UPF0755 protein